jgi:peroxiredoxin
VHVLGVSFDPPEVNRAFAVKNGFGFRLLSDVGRDVALAYGACDAVSDAFPRRVTFVIGADGTIEQAIRTRDPAAQAEQLAFELARRT